jgi:DNA invertase Pin-like site-specific DNA recombinase
VYTRKSSEEGLEQCFNSLDAQREACLAYVQSQRHEGWRVLDGHYDDGGYSGGTMERPALAQLLKDIDAGKVDSVVVYKVDRLTRSLANFAKIVEIFDAKGVSFVSVTQHFNTTTSMGRLTLNVLLSFAQFEREVTGERIRDKIAASKKKGMWMGGYVPLGYDLKDRKLVVNPTEGELVCQIFLRYADLGSVAKLKAELDSRGVRSKVRINAAGKDYGGADFSRGALYNLLQNRLYLGETVHRGQSHPGEHHAIVPKELWDRVKALLEANTLAKHNGAKARDPSLLAGLLYDNHGNRLTPSHAVKGRKRYRYYVSQAVIHHRHGAVGSAKRIPAHEVEDLVCRRLCTLLASDTEILEAVAAPADDAQTRETAIIAARRQAKGWSKLEPADTRAFLRSVVMKITIHDELIEILVTKLGIREALLGAADATPTSLPPSGQEEEDDSLRLTVDARLRRCGGEVRLVIPGTRSWPPARSRL